MPFVPASIWEFLVLCLVGVLILAPTAALVSSLFYFAFVHPEGSFQLIVKSVLLCTVFLALVAIGFAYPLLLILFLPFIFLKKSYVSIKSWCEKKKQPPGERCDNEGRETLVVHLLHGTFEPDAPWTRSDSPLSKKISQALPDEKIAFKAFRWSGDNTGSARNEAAKEFAKHIDSNKTPRQIIVAHSHAGNIVKTMFRESRNAEILKKIKGIAFLSTPFIHKKRLNRLGDVYVHLHTIGFAIVVPTLFAAAVLYIKTLWSCLAAFLPQNRRSWVEGHFAWASWANLDIPLPFVLGGVFFIMIIIDLIVSKIVRDEIEKDLEEVEGNNDLPGNIHVKVFVAIGDEADAVLRMAGTLHEVCLSVFAELRRATELFVQNKWMVLLLMSLVHLAGYFLLKDKVPTSHFEIQPLTVIFILSFCTNIFFYLKDAKFVKDEDQVKTEYVPTALILAAMPISMASFMINAIKAYAFGDLRYIFYPKAFFHSSETPSGDQQITKFMPVSDGTLNHSSHSNTSVIDSVAKWAEEAAKKSV